PDEQNSFSSGNIDFFHLRLSILDITCGKQPMHLDDRYTIIFNGEIYNHAEIRKQLNITGKTNSDTETLLLLYKKLGTEFLNYLDGMFVLAIYDAIERKLFIARDRAGKKPLHIFNDGHKIVFASELNALKQLLPLEFNQDNFYHYTRFGTFYRTLTPYKNVSELAAGSFLEINCTTLEVREKRWWDIGDFYRLPNNDTLEQSLEKNDAFLTAAVKRRLESSDLEVGCFLSGGIDSGLVTAIASRFNNRLKTFTVSFDGEYDEAPLAKLVADRYGTDHTEIKISFDHLADDVEKIIGNYGEPFFDSSAIPSYYVSREAKKHLTVILNGDGADELFGGYRRYVPFSKYDFFKKNPFVKTTAGLIKNILPMPDNKKSSFNYLYRLASLASRSDLEIYLSAGVDIMEDYEENLLNPGFDYLQPMRDDFKKISMSGMSGLKKIMNMDFDTNLFSDLLVKMDIATMANSLEGRSPFLCRELLEYVPGMNDTYKINGSTTKYLLRTLAKKYLPETLINQPKRGFEIPLKSWVNNQLKEVIHDHIGAPGAFNRNIINHNFTEKLLADKINIPAEKRAKIIWMLFCLEVWYKKHYSA
ncbi:MAG TPA: asparagine synthase (glutamine-hydrolyzing), partial [Ferruginibacter sp.]|nr:asparagine synthase (glutamine-hydrolyzing) [Ferruginibacter sp.]